MEWDLKVPPPPWSLEELDRDPGLSIGSVVVGSAALCRTGESDCSVDLKLGGLGEFGSSNKWNGGQSSSAAATAAATTTSTSVTVAMAMAMMPPPSPPSKRQRAPASGAHGAACSVDGCRADLSKCREYHRRHKVCEAHSKTPVVVVRGQEQRFCQQCSRFHLLEEFDEVKRSCRKRLDGHNRRRRKPQPGSGNAGSLFPDLQATGFSTYPQIFLNAAPESNWTRIVKTEDTALYSPPQFINQQHFPSPSCVFSNERKQITFFQDGETGMGSKSTQNSANQMNLRTTAPLRSSGSSKIFNDRLTQVFDSDCALSLLSSPIQTSDINLSHIVSPSDQIPVAQPLISSLQYGGLMQYSLPQATNNVTPTGFSCAGRMEEPNVGTALVSDHATDTEINCHSMFHVDHEGSDSACQTLPFSWP